MLATNAARDVDVSLQMSENPENRRRISGQTPMDVTIPSTLRQPSHYFTDALRHFVPRLSIGLRRTETGSTILQKHRANQVAASRDPMHNPHTRSKAGTCQTA
ncbi:hypothetical protein GCM10027021_08730 [Dyella kyungheensis]